MSIEHEESALYGNKKVEAIRNAQNDDTITFETEQYESPRAIELRIPGRLLRGKEHIATEFGLELIYNVRKVGKSKSGNFAIIQPQVKKVELVYGGPLSEWSYVGLGTPSNNFGDGELRRECQIPTGLKQPTFVLSQEEDGRRISPYRTGKKSKQK